MRFLIAQDDGPRRFSPPHSLPSIFHIATGLLALIGAAVASANAPIPGRRLVENGSGGGAPACTACHGVALQGNPAGRVPAIAGRSANFILARLEHYASPEGHNALMKQVAKALSPTERQAVARYISQLPKR